MARELPAFVILPESTPQFVVSGIRPGRSMRGTGVAHATGKVTRMSRHATPTCIRGTLFRSPRPGGRSAPEKRTALQDTWVRASAVLGKTLVCQTRVFPSTGPHSFCLSSCRSLIHYRVYAPLPLGCRVPFVPVLASGWGRRGGVNRTPPGLLAGRPYPRISRAQPDTGSFALAHAACLVCRQTSPVGAHRSRSGRSGPGDPRLD